MLSSLFFRAELFFPSNPLNPHDWSDVILEVDFRSQNVTISVDDVSSFLTFDSSDAMTWAQALTLTLGNKG